MPLVRRIRNKGSVVTVEAHAEVLFTPGGPLGSFARRFTEAAKVSTAAHAPGNKRPTWGHEPAAHGKPLKASFKAATAYRPNQMAIFSAVGSSAPYAAFVDQGTGVFNLSGGSPWLAKILPPSTALGSDLYEHTWRPGGKPVAEVWIKGQKPQRFFQAGLDDAFKAMRIPNVKVPGEVGSPAFPDSLVRHVTSAIDYGSGSAFEASLVAWRKRRDAAWLSGNVLGSGSFSRRNTRAAERIRTQRRKRAADARKYVRDLQRPTAQPVRPTMTNEEKYRASKAAADARRTRQEAEIRRQRDARALGAQRRAEERERLARVAAERRANTVFESARRDAYAYAARLRPAYPNIEVLIAKARGTVRVRWTDSTGATHHQDFR